MFCPSCGAPNLDSAEKCISCQRALPKLNEVTNGPEASWPVIQTPQIPSTQSSSFVSQQVNTYSGAPSGVSNYNNVPTAAPIDSIGISGYGNVPPFGATNTYVQPGVSNYSNTPNSYTVPLDRVGVSSYGYNNVQYPSYGLPVDQTGISRPSNNFWPRVGAYLIDQIICSFIFGIVFGIPLLIWGSGFAAKYTNEISNTCSSSYNYTNNYNNSACNRLLQDIFLNRGELSSLLATTISTFILGIILVLAYQVLLTARGQTIGKRVFGLKVIRSDGSAPGFGTALLRQTLGYFISNFFFGLGFLWVAFDSNNRGWHDLIANTFVVQARQ